MEKKYDSTLARVAGNIASGLVPLISTSLNLEDTHRTIAYVSVSIAKMILKYCEKDNND